MRSAFRRLDGLEVLQTVDPTAQPIRYTLFQLLLRPLIVYIHVGSLDYYGRSVGGTAVLPRSTTSTKFLQPESPDAMLRNSVIKSSPFAHGLARPLGS